MKFPDSLKQKLSQLKTESYALYLAYKDPRIPWYARLILACIVAYPFSPIDKFLDYIPVIGYLDHLILVPIVVALIFKKMIPRAVLADCQEKAHTIMAKNKTKSWHAGFVIIGIWFLFASLVVLLTARTIGDWNLIVMWWIGLFRRVLT